MSIVVGSSFQIPPEITSMFDSSNLTVSSVQEVSIQSNLCPLEAHNRWSYLTNS